MLFLRLTLASLCLWFTQAWAANPQQTFLEQAFGKKIPQAQMLWLNKNLHQRITPILQHPPTFLRIRHWHRNTTRAFILEEIGKHEPITFGVIVKNGAIESLKVLNYRESRGGEIRYPFFTQQFRRLHLTADDRLSGTIDGISGATLSVRASRKMAQLALIFDQHLTNHVPL